MRAGDPFLALLACPRCAGPLSAPLLCPACGPYDAPDGVPDLRLATDARTEAVRAFYSKAPFPGYPPRDGLAALRARAGRSALAQLLDRAIPGDARVLEVGCGTGQLGLFLASADRLVVGADLTRASLALAGQARERYGLEERALFVETDLRAPGLRRGAFDVVLCNGVLHHTPDPRASFAALARLVRPGGILVVGLYNAIARLPHRLRRALARASGFRVLLDPVLRARAQEPERREAWLRDQYLHPEEHRHTLGEVQGWLRENGVEFLRSYPDALLGLPPVEGDELFTAAEDDWAVERALAQLSWAVTLAHEGGLFVVIGRAGARAEAVR